MPMNLGPAGGGKSHLSSGKLDFTKDTGTYTSILAAWTPCSQSTLCRLFKDMSPNDFVFSLSIFYSGEGNDVLLRT